MSLTLDRITLAPGFNANWFGSRIMSLFTDSTMNSGRRNFQCRPANICSLCARRTVVFVAF